MSRRNLAALMAALAVVHGDTSARGAPVPHEGPGKPGRRPVESSHLPIAEHDCRQARRRQARLAAREEAPGA